MGQPVYKLHNGGTFVCIFQHNAQPDYKHIFLYKKHKMERHLHQTARDRRQNRQAALLPRLRRRLRQNNRRLPL